MKRRILKQNEQNVLHANLMYKSFVFMDKVRLLKLFSMSILIAIFPFFFHEHSPLCTYTPLAAYRRAVLHFKFCSC